MVKYLINENIISENVGLKENDDVMLYNQVTEDVHVINSTAFEIFSELDNAKSETEICEIIKKRYAVEDDLILDDIKEILSDFLMKGLINEIKSE